MLAHWSARSGDTERGLLHALSADREHQHDDTNGPMHDEPALAQVEQFWRFCPLEMAEMLRFLTCSQTV
jgi:hypothetical protein